MKKFAILVLATFFIMGGFLYIRKTPTTKKEILPEEQKIIQEIPEKKYTRVALVVDDWGYNKKNVDRVFELGIPVTLSILPNLTYSKTIAREASKRNYQTILHLPLEPHHDKMPLEKETIFCDMEREEIIKKLSHAIDSVPDLSGISNHMGSKATEDERLMSIIFEKLKKDDLFFMDNLVTPNSICKTVAGRVGIGLVCRSVFLDNESDMDYIKNQINQLASQALRAGWAVGVGHDRSKTMSALEEMIPKLKKSGIKFVFLSELAK